MPKLKGLLDSANAKLAGLLGDFPQGFNAGAVAGFPGWAGDMAYLADTARLALTGADSQAAPEDYVGTTDYIAKQAGFPVPQTLSGQLGAAVGGLMSPGPGDLAKFAPLGAMFLGAKAKTAMPDVLEYAQAMDKAGKSADEIWQTTGKLGQPWFKGADGKWRFEVEDRTDVSSRFASALNAEDELNLPLVGALGYADETIRAYPELARLNVNVIPGEGGKYRGKGIDVGQFGGMPVLLHEVQHAVDDLEGFAAGGTPENASQWTDEFKAWSKLRGSGTPEEEAAYRAIPRDWDAYNRLAGEVGARNTASRMNLTMDERLPLPPWATQDVPTERQIVRFGDGPAMAIPFWHGSPHKFDRFDLAHMGKGEGAQAYGWGAYGAESPEVAKQYLNVDPSVPVPPRRQFMGQDLEPGTPEYHAARLASEGKESLAGLRKLVAGWISDARPGEPTDGYQKTLEILNQAQKKSDFKQLKPEPYLYRGEYRWPDPAKEAATPLTGEDLLQWDRPLSEQPKNVQEALAAIDPDTYHPSGNDYDPMETGQMIYHRLMNQKRDYAITAGKNSETTQEASQRAASQELNDLGIPGIRYLDGMSRTDGSGTHNLVMFSDEGIKLLERNGTPIEDFAARRAGKARPYKELAMDEASRMQRAQEMGFDVDNPVYHGTRTKGDAIDAFDLEKAGSKTDAGYMGKGIYFGNDKTANVYAGHYEFDPGHFPEGGAVYPSYLALKSPLRLDDKIENGRSVDLELLARDALGLPREATAEQVTQEALRQGYDGAIYSRGAGKYQEYVVYQPEKIRSKFAAFDPAKKDSSNLLAGAAATALGLGLARQQLNEEQRNGM